jgi:hypothetical protein
VSLAEVYPRLLEKGRRVRELIGMLQLKASAHEPEGVALILDLESLLRDLKKKVIRENLSQGSFPAT